MNEPQEPQEPQRPEAQPEAAPAPKVPEARERELPPEEPPGRGLLRMGIVFAVLFVLNLIYGAVKGTLMPTFLGLVVSPVLGAGVVVLVLGSVRDLRRGPRQRGIVVLFVLFSLLGYLASGALARSMLFPGCPTALPAAGTELEGGKVIAYTTADGVALKGFLIRGRGPAPRPAVLHFHGNADCAAYNVGWASQLASRNLDVFIAEYRGYAGCPGTPSEAGMLEDGLAALKVLEEQVGARPQDVVISGQSLGTGVACLVAGEGNGRAVFLLSPFSSARSMAERMVTPPLAAFAVRDPFESQENLLRVDVPVVIMHGNRDPVIPYEEGKSLAAALGERARFITLEGAGHNDVFSRYGRLIADTLAALAHGK